MRELSSLKTIVVLTDGIQGHNTQSMGIGYWLSMGTGAQLRELPVPLLDGTAKMMSRIGAKELLSGSRRKAREWLGSSGGDGLASAFSALVEHGTEASCALISSGSRTAPYNLALGLLLKITCVTVMTPSVIGTEPFDYAVVPEHDAPRRRPNLLTTVGAPNMIIPDELPAAAEAFMESYPSEAPLRWGVMVGGDDRNYRVTSQWVKQEIGKLIRHAEKRYACVYIITSRRTAPDTEEALARIAARSPSVKFIRQSSGESPVAGLLGACSSVFVTEDSVSMVSEAATAGHQVILMRVPRRGGLSRGLGAVARSAAELKLCPDSMLFGPPKFEMLFSALKRENRLVEWDDVNPADFEPVHHSGFNEARRAAEWLYSCAFVPKDLA